ncbi:flagellar FliJ family protein [Phenylobacterium sp. J367]|uniref:flagellar FliJ family protein n=1 Tax=Phenylobacterium sp. J367 TaxID=2898435 RepID=UPI00215147BC|nr:flagellar FliJ family protein [Phenylobacterium sp. J367]MCR5878999.1 flagellar FliJ family protein [Phenylobacterium sp. J367]
MSWADSLIKLSGYEVETLQKRLAEIGDRRRDAEMRLAMLFAQGDAEAAATDPTNTGDLLRFLEHLKVRKQRVQGEIEIIMAEESGARDALAQAFEEQKKYEHLAEQARIAEAKKQGRIEAAAMDELGLRKSAR